MSLNHSEREKIIKEAEVDSQRPCEHCSTRWHISEEHEDEYMEEWVAEMTKRLRAQRDACLDKIKELTKEPIIKDLRGRGHLNVNQRLQMQSIYNDKGCQLLTKKPTTSGRVQIKISGKLLEAARFIYRSHHGEDSIPKGFQIVATCTNKNCINIEHLKAMSVSDQVAFYKVHGNRL